MFASKDIFLKSSGGGYQISRSVRLRSSATAYLNRTPTVASNRRTWTWSSWVKRGTLTSSQYLFSQFGGTTYDQFRFDSDDTLQATLNNGTSANIRTSAVFRDPAAWYHLVFSCDTTNATANDRLQIWVNGVRQSLGTNTQPAQNYDTYLNTINAFNIGRLGSGIGYLDGYLTEINFIDGQALTPSSFGETNPVTGVWQPKKYAGTYGTNGFYLNFSDNSAATATTIGKDYSGNGNNWTPNNISVTAGVTYDSMLDVPTPFADRGNYCVLNPLDDNTNMAPSSGNLDWVNAGATQYSTRSTIFPTSGKWYAEFTISSSAAIIAIANQNAPVQGLNGLNGVFAITTQIFNNSGTAAQTGLAAFAAGNVIAVAYDADTNSVQFYRNNSTYGTAVTPSATGPFCFFVGANGAACTINANFGQRPFSYTPPTGFVALNTQNLPTPTISNGASYMAATTYTGTGSVLTIANTVGSASFQPDFVWIKARSFTGGGVGHMLADSVRGGTQVLHSDQTTAEQNNLYGAIGTFNSNGFTTASGSVNSAEVQQSTFTYVAWQWNAGGSTVTNTSGSISSQVRANPTAGFSVVGYTGTGANATVGHGLGVAPSMIITKVRSTSGADWNVYHASVGNTKSLFLNTTAVPSTSVNFWNNTSPTSTVFSVGISGGTNNSGNTMIAYCFAAVAGYSAFGSYTGNGSTDGPFVYTGFRPRWVMIKRTDGTADWIILDTSRDSYNMEINYLIPNTAGAEATGASIQLDGVSNGIKIRGTWVGMNASGGTYIYMAFAENPFKNSLAR